jgi:hypothetical protein
MTYGKKDYQKSKEVKYLLFKSRYKFDYNVRYNIFGLINFRIRVFFIKKIKLIIFLNLNQTYYFNIQNFKIFPLNFLN